MSTNHSVSQTLAAVTPLRPNIFAPGHGSGDNGGMEYVPRPELDAKLERDHRISDGRENCAH